MVIANDLRPRVSPMRDDDPRALDPILDRLGSASVVLLGEASHGTDEFYRIRAKLTEELISNRGFSAVIVEADWADAYRVHRYVRGESDDGDAPSALGDFRRFPRWMWRNEAVGDFVEWLRRRNARREPSKQAGFYGMDLYGMHASMAHVLSYLDRVDPRAARRARERYECLDRFGPNPQRYGYASSIGLSSDCEDEVVSELVDLRRDTERHLRKDGYVARDEAFFAEENARVVKNAERYYRAMFQPGENTWNLRDTHMVETVDGLRRHLAQDDGRPPKVVVWAHNSHLGDARFTERRRVGELNVGQLLREAHGDDCHIVGFSTNHGSVAAASDWDGPVERKRVRPALEGSWERLFHDVGLRRLAVVMDAETRRILRGARLNRAIGVIYRPETERASHYFFSEIGGQFDAVVHVDETSAVTPLEPPRGWAAPDLPETYPHGV